MATAEKYVNNYTAKKCKYYTIPNSLHFVMCCRHFIFCFRIWFFLWTLFFRSVLYKGFDDVNHIIYCKKKKEIHVYSLWPLRNLPLKPIRSNGKLLKYDKKCITLLGCTGLRKTAYQFLFRSLRVWTEYTINDRTIF